jgi:hypothetical protein
MVFHMADEHADLLGRRWNLCPGVDPGVPDPAC